MPTSDQWLAISFLLYLVAPVVLYLVGAFFVWVFRKVRGRPGADGEAPEARV